jgi:hypothetical protein
MMKTPPMLFLLTASLASFTSAEAAGAAEAGDAATHPNQMKITVGKRVFTATLEDNKTAAAFRALLPLTVEMHDVNRNEKAYDLPERLPTADANPRQIEEGDLMIWNSRTVVVFYQGFPTSYRYTRLGRVDDPEGLAEALGKGEVTVTFELNR